MALRTAVHTLKSLYTIENMREGRGSQGREGLSVDHLLGEKARSRRALQS